MPEVRLLPDQLESPRLVLKRHELALAPAMFKCVDQDRERLRVFLPWVDVTRTVLDEAIYITMTQDRWEKGSLFDYGMCLKGDGDYLGNIGVHNVSWENLQCEIGYWILGAHEGKGYVSEALGVLEQALFKIGINRLEIRCSVENKKSMNVPKRNGYTLEQTLRLHTIEQGSFRDTHIFFKNRPKSAQNI